MSYVHIFVEHDIYMRASAACYSFRQDRETLSVSSAFIPPCDLSIYFLAPYQVHGQHALWIKARTVYNFLYTLTSAD